MKKTAYGQNETVNICTAVWFIDINNDKFLVAETETEILQQIATAKDATPLSNGDFIFIQTPISLLGIAQILGCIDAFEVPLTK